MSKNEIEIEESAQQISIQKQDIKYDTRDFAIEYIKEQFQQDEFYVPQEYQRKFIWSDDDKCYFIESILMGLPIPFMFFSDTEDGRIEIVDGAQRTQTLVQFCQNDLELKNLKILTKSNGFKFKDFDLSIQRRFLKTSIRVVFLDEGTTETVRKEIFKRINISGEHANSSEIRRGSYIGEFNTFLEQCTKNEIFNNLAPRTTQTEKRYEGFELVSRFFAYSDNYENDFEEYTGNVTEYIDNYVEEQNQLCKDQKNIIEKHNMEFNNMINYAQKVLGSRGFRKNEKSKSTPRARFEALAIGISVALKEKPDLPPRDVSEWIDGEEFTKLTRSDAANNKSKLVRRINFVKDKLLEGD